MANPVQVRRSTAVRGQLVTLSLVLFLGACGGEGNSSQPSPSAPPSTPPPAQQLIASVSVSPPTAELAPPAVVTLTATARDASGAVIGGRAATWSSVNPAVATVDALGAVTAVAAGSATIQATIGGVIGAATITVIPAPVVTVVVAPANASVVAGSTTALTVTARDSRGIVLTDRPVTWSSSDATIATISATGVVTGVTPGSATITASVGGSASTALVTVLPRPVARVDVSPAATSMILGTTTTLVATARDSAGTVVSGRMVTWSSSANTVAPVGINGVVTAVSPGTATIRATVDGISGVSTVTVASLPPATMEVVGSATQQGLIGRPLADSLAVRVRAANGTPVANVPVSWATAQGALSTGSTVTDAQDVARVQWIPSPGAASATATAAGLPIARFEATTRAGGACTIAPSAATRRFSLGPTDFTLSLRSSAPLRIAVLFVDYPGLPASENAEQLARTIVDPGIALLREMSYGRVNISTVVFPTWYRMPQPITSYTWSTYDGHRRHLLDVLSITDPSIDFSSFDALYVFSPPAPDKPVSPTFNGGITANVVADGRNFGNAVTFGNDSRSQGPAITVHETGHMFGLVDLYAFATNNGPVYSGHPFRFVGAWSPMSNVFNPAHILTWEKRKLGWIDESQVDCLDAQGGVEAVITPNQTVGGRKMVVVPIDTSSAIVVEVRNNLALEANLCSSGVLIYQVDARTQTGQGPAQLLGSRLTTSGNAFNKCGPWADATFGWGAPPITSYVHSPTGTSVTVLGAETGGAYRVRVKR
jgi:M6 family metalloprotease-like protein